LRSTVGEGSRVALVLPMGVAVSQVMIVESEGESFGIPMGQVLQTSRRVDVDVASIGGRPTTSYRGGLVPLLGLGERLDLKRRSDDAPGYVVMVSDGDRVAALSVDRIAERMDVIQKPLSGVMSSFRAFTGTALLGDGRVLLILDLEEVLA